jgi:hypothetical protein
MHLVNYEAGKSVDWTDFAKGLRHGLEQRKLTRARRLTRAWRFCDPSAPADWQFIRLSLS